METEKYYFRVGAFFLLVLAAFVWGLIFFSSGHESGSLMRYAVYFDGTVSGLTRGAPVKLRGITIGIVDDIRFLSRENDRILVTVDVSENAPIRKDTVASVAFQGITGTTYLALENTDADGASAPLVKEKGEKYPVIRSEGSGLQTAEMVGSVTKTAAQLQKLLSDKNIVAFQGLMAESQNVLTEATGALREVKMLARTVREDPSVIVRGTNYGGYKTQK